MSGYVPSDVEQEVRRLGADEVLTKPQPLPELARVLASILGSRRDGK
jgi:CheY-like chemotaxis protein